MTLSRHRHELYQQVRNGVGASPLVPVSLANGCRVHCKEEWRNPSGSHYDRVFVVLLEALEKQGRIVPAVTELVDATTGNAGAALARACQILGFPCKVFLPEDVPFARKQQIMGYGASLVETPERQYVKGAVRELQRYLVKARKERRRVFCLDHSRQSLAIEALSPIAVEIAKELDSQLPDFFVGVIGNGLTIKGIGRGLQSFAPSLRIIGVEPVRAPSTYEQKYPGRFQRERDEFPTFAHHGLLGAGAWGVRFPFIDPDDYDDITLVTQDNWLTGQGFLKDVGVASGRTSGACQWVAHQIAQTEDDLTFVHLCYDHASKYGTTSAKNSAHEEILV